MSKAVASLEEASKIYGRGARLKPLTEYEIAINAASLKLSQEDPSLLVHRDKLFEKARGKVREDGFKFKKGLSRSKSVTDTSDGKKNELTVKSVKTSSYDRKHRLEQIEKELDETQKAIKIKEHRRNKAQSVKNFSLCDTLSTEIRSLLSEKGTLEQEQRILKRKEGQSNWYLKGKCKKVSSNSKANNTSNKRSHTATISNSWSKFPKKETCTQVVPSSSKSENSNTTTSGVTDSENEVVEVGYESPSFGKKENHSTNNQRETTSTKRSHPTSLEKSLPKIQKLEDTSTEVVQPTSNLDVEKNNTSEDIDTNIQQPANHEPEFESPSSTTDSSVSQQPISSTNSDKDFRISPQANMH